MTEVKPEVCKCCQNVVQVVDRMVDGAYWNGLCSGCRKADFVISDLTHDLEDAIRLIRQMLIDANAPDNRQAAMDMIDTHFRRRR